MNHLNYFEPYQSKNARHEDNLTRAFLVVLRHSISALMLFYDQAVKSCLAIRAQKQKSFSLPFFSELDYKNLSYHTQKSDISEIIGSSVLSVLITDENFEVKNDVQLSTRGARYDGVISFGDQLSLIIENKPKSFNVWEEQLSPNLKGLEDKVELIPVPAIIPWSEIIKNLNSLTASDQVSSSEKTIITDFLDFVDNHFPFLNPYDNLEQCKKDRHLIYRRIKNLVAEMAVSEDSYAYQSKWKSYYLETGLKEIRMVIIEILFNDENDYSLRTALYYGDTMNQARSYFDKKIPYSKASSLKKKGWNYKSNFHISSINSIILMLETKPKYDREYYNYWLKNRNMINQVSKEEVIRYLKYLKSENIISIDKEKNQEIDNVIINTNRSTFNICPGFGLSFSIDSTTAEKLDSKNELAEFMKTKFKEGLSILTDV